MLGSRKLASLFRLVDSLPPCTSLRSIGTSSSRASQLYFDEVHSGADGAAAASGSGSGGGSGGGSPAAKTIVVLHGLLGTGRNLRGVMTELCRQAAAASGTPWRALLLDLRNHGKSARLGLHPPHTLAAAAHDVISLWQHQLGGRAPDVVIGHSMGGKTALEVVRQLALPGAPPTGQPKQVWVLDARPTAVHQIDKPTREVMDVLSAVQSVPLPLASRNALYDHLQQRGFSVGLQQWLGSSLAPEGGHAGGSRLVWTFNVEGAAAMFDDYCKLDYSQLLRSPPRGVTLNILRALRSDRWDVDTLGVIKAAVAATAQPAAVRGRTRFHELPDAGHWVHTDNPKGLVQLMLPSLVDAARI